MTCSMAAFRFTGPRSLLSRLPGRVPNCVLQSWIVDTVLVDNTARHMTLLKQGDSCGLFLPADLLLRGIDNSSFGAPFHHTSVLSDLPEPRQSIRNAQVEPEAVFGNYHSATGSHTSNMMFL